MFWIFYLLLAVILKFTLSFDRVQQRKGFRKFLLKYIQNINVKKYLITTFVILMVCGNSVLMNEINVLWEGTDANKSISDITPKEKPYPRTAIVLASTSLSPATSRYGTRWIECSRILKPIFSFLKSASTRKPLFCRDFTTFSQY